MLNKKCRLLFVGDSSYDMYVKAYYNAAKKMNDIEADLIDFDKLNTSISKDRFILRFERHYKFGYHIGLINKTVIEFVNKKKPDIVFLYTCDIITAATVKSISRKTYVAIYNNDNPFSKYYPKYQWQHFLKGLKYANIVYSFRKSNIEEYKRNGAVNVKIMRGYYIKERNYYIPDEDISFNVPKVCFLGHYEDDGRIQYIKALSDKGIDVGVPSDWKRYTITCANISYLENTHTHYNELLNKTKIAIVFLSHINDDTYTTRNFEIPAVKTMMLTPDNNDIRKLFVEGKEAVFYTDVDSFVEKVMYYLSNESEREEIAEAGYERLIHDGHEASDRVRDIIMDWEQNR